MNPFLSCGGEGKDCESREDEGTPIQFPFISLLRSESPCLSKGRRRFDSLKVRREIPQSSIEERKKGREEERERRDGRDGREKGMEWSVGIEKERYETSEGREEREEGEGGRRGERWK